MARTSKLQCVSSLALGSLLAVVVPLGMALPALAVNAYLQEFTYATGSGGFTAGRLTSTDSISWKCGVPAEENLSYFPSAPPRKPTWGWPYTWGTAQNAVGANNTISGSYYGGEKSYVQSPLINLSEYSGRAPILTWTQYANMAGSDEVGVMVSNNGGFSWTTAYYAHGNATGGQIVDGNTRVLDPLFATNSFRVRFYIWSYSTPVNGYPSYQHGFYFDNISIDFGDGYDPPVTVPVDRLSDGETLASPGTFANDVSVTTETDDGAEVAMLFAAGTTVYKDGQVYTGSFWAPWHEDYYDADDYGMPNADDVLDLTAYGVGLYSALTFDRPVRLCIPGQGGKQVGWSNGSTFTASPLLADDDPGLLDVLGIDDGYLSVDSNGDGRSDPGDDLIVYTKHFTYVLLYNAVPEPACATLLVLGGFVLVGWRRRRA
ncbi:MAG: PEP-CTERM sorting domain-containing protein [Pirellulaceae bacterium]|nr:PEP-CTERM sorting domain-containing protein [Pirellulaceae bacterium]